MGECRDESDAERLCCSTADDYVPSITTGKALKACNNIFIARNVNI